MPPQVTANPIPQPSPPKKPTNPANAAPDYEPKPVLENTAYVGLQSAGVGLLVSAVQNALDRHPQGASGVITRTGGTIGFFAAMGAVFTFTESALANARATNDPLNGLAGGCAAGFLAGIRARSIPIGAASCAIIGGIIGTFDAAGGSLTGGVRDFDTNETREERRRKFFKKPRQPVTVGAPVSDEGV